MSSCRGRINRSTKNDTLHVYIIRYINAPIAMRYDIYDKIVIHPLIDV